MSNDSFHIARQLRRSLNPNAVSVDGPWQWGTIQAVSTGTCGVYLDNNQGTVTPNVPYLSSYSPAVGDAVLIGRMQGAARTARIILGKLNGSGGGGSNVSTPTGVVSPYAGSSAPSGWLLCDGSAVDRITYATLFTTLGTTYGSGDGTTTFNLPDMRGRTAQGVGSVGTNAQPTLALAASGGEQNHTLTTAELASHSHGHTHGSHAHSAAGQILVGQQSSSGLNTGLGAGGSNYTKVGELADSSPTNTGNAISGTTPTSDATTAGSGTSHNTMQPYLALNYIIKT